MTNKPDNALKKLLIDFAYEVSLSEELPDKEYDVEINRLYKIYTIELLDFIQAHTDSVLREILEQKKTYVTELAWKHAASEEAVPTSVIQEKLSKQGGE